MHHQNGKLEDCYIELDSDPHCHPLIEKATDRSQTFIELTAFVRRNRKEIDTRAAERARLSAVK
jgi:hypothetical protein